MYHSVMRSLLCRESTTRSNQRESKGSVSQLMDDLDLIIEQVEVMVNSIQKGVENALQK